MENLGVYENIAKRTNGDIYIGVVGPVRTGKSTFIKKFLEQLVLPNIKDGLSKERAIDEMPQSAAGRTIMTTEPKFVPEEAINISIDNCANLKVRLIDCVGYIVPSALGYIENEEPRMVMTPWFDKPIPFNMAAEIGTQKVITEHSTIGLVVTTDGSVSEIPREEYEEAEERVINELTELNKPFSIVLNCVNPLSPEAQELREKLEEKYSVPVAAVNCLNLTEADISAILQGILYQFPLREISVSIPKWLLSLDKDHWLRSEIFSCIIDAAAPILKLKDIPTALSALGACPHLTDFEINSIDFGTGNAKTTAHINPRLFYQIIKEQTGIEVENEAELMPIMIELAKGKKEYQCYKNAIDAAMATGYGIAMPMENNLTLAPPEITKQSGRYGVKFKATVPSLHVLRADVVTTVSPIVGSEEQSRDLLNSLISEYETNPEKIWESNIFGKSLYSLVNEGLNNKLNRMPSDAQQKLAQTVQRVINEGCSGLICIIL
ncbi:MAG: stage IV sporulation protein A [Oscillospiraceae bacterium]